MTASNETLTVAVVGIFVVLAAMTVLQLSLIEFLCSVCRQLSEQIERLHDQIAEDVHDSAD